MEKKYTYYGIDVSQSSLQISYQSLQGAWQETEIANQIIAISEWLQNIDLTQSWFIYEYTGNYSSPLSYALNLVEAQFTILTPSQSKGFRATLKSISKTDKQDARMLCQYGQKMQPEATALADVALEKKRQKYKYFEVVHFRRTVYFAGLTIHFGCKFVQIFRDFHSPKPNVGEYDYNTPQYSQTVLSEHLPDYQNSLFLTFHV
jgi:Transposase